MPLDAPPCAAHDGFIMNANSDKDYIDTKASDLRMVMDAGFSQSRSESDARTAKAVLHLIKWMAGIFVASVAINVSLASMVMSLIQREHPAVSAPPVQAYSTPAVIIQLTPQGATVVPAAPAVGKP
jgi:hypothetical protein